MTPAKRILIALTCGFLLAAKAPAAKASEGRDIQLFHQGVTHFEKGKHAKALAIFRRSYALKARAATLQNIALCQKQLFRYAAASSSLRLLLREHGKSLSSSERQVVEGALKDLAPFVARLTLEVQPPEAQITIDGRPILGAGVRSVELSVGEHKLAGVAAYHQPLEETISVTGGVHERRVHLKPTVGKVEIRLNDPDGAIAIDGKPRGYGEWSGELTTGKSHVVLVYKPGHANRRMRVEPVADAPKRLVVSLGPKLGSDVPKSTPPFPYQPPKEPTVKAGLYGFVGVDSAWLFGDPATFRLGEESLFGRQAAHPMLRLGLMLNENMGLEMHASTGTHLVGPGCQLRQSTPCANQRENYDLRATQIGLLGRYMSHGRKLRWFGTLGAGLSRLCLTHRPLDQPLAPHSLSGTNAFVRAELGVQGQVRRLLVEGLVFGTGAGASSIRQGHEPAYSRGHQVAFVGIGMRLGLGLW